MTANPHLAPQLDAYLALPSPGFAIMIDAPWGAGKTHSVKAWLHGKKHCYISLFGVASIEGVEEALFNRLLEAKEVKIPSGFTRLAEGLAEKYTGVTINLTGFHRQHVLKDLPGLLVFDDLERSRLEPAVLLAALNRFVEQEDRKVILIANESELERSEDYRKWREKVVGRTITLRPETELALDACLGSLAAGDARDFLTERRDLIVSVFNGSATCNLRLLRQSVTEFAALLALLPEDIRNRGSGIWHLLATFLALSIAYHAGQIDRGDFYQDVGWARAAWRASGRNGDEPSRPKLEALQERYASITDVKLDGSAIDDGLALKLIAEGYETPSAIAKALRDLASFQDEADQPWVTLFFWRHRDEADVTAALAHVQAQLDRKEITKPTIILHLWGVFTGFAKHGIGPRTESEVSRKFKDYIAVLESDGLLPDDDPKRHWNFALLQESSHGLGFAYLGSPEFEDIRGCLIAALDRAFQSGGPRRLDQVLGLLRNDVEGFVQAISGTRDRDDIPDFSQVPLFSNADPRQVAEILCSLPPEAMHSALRPFKDRLMRLTVNAHGIPDLDAAGRPEDPERSFLKAMREDAIKIARGSTPIRAAQIKNSLYWNLGFLDPSSTDHLPNP